MFNNWELSPISDFYINNNNFNNSCKNEYEKGHDFAVLQFFFFIMIVFLQFFATFVSVINNLAKKTGI